MKTVLNFGTIFTFIPLKSSAMNKIFCTLLLLTSYTLSYSQDTLTMLFAGDIMGHDTQINAAKRDSGYEYDTTFSYLQPLFASHDLTIGNLELTLGIKPYKGYPQFSSPVALAEALKNAGFDILVTSNNHTCDRGKDGIVNTLLVLDTLDIIHTGSFRNQAEKDKYYPLVVRAKGYKLGFLNYTYGTNGLPAPEPTRVNYLDTGLMRQDLNKLDSLAVDKKIAITHWGKEYVDLPNAYQKKYANFLHEGGVQYVIGAHPHVIQPVYNDTLKDQLTAYSLGNFVSNQRTHPRDGGMMLRLELVRDSTGNVKLNRAHYILTWVYTPVVDGQKYFFILPASMYEHKKDFFISSSHYDKMKTYLKHARALFSKHNQNVSEYKWNQETQSWGTH